MQALCFQCVRLVKLVYFIKAVFALKPTSQCEQYSCLGGVRVTPTSTFVNIRKICLRIKWRIILIR